MSDRPPISKGELTVARVVWRLGEASAGEVFDAFANDGNLDYTTVHTYLRRLEEKGYLRTRRKGRNKIYRPKVRPSQVVREIVEDLMDHVFDGEAIALMHHLIRDRGMTPEETRKVRQMLSDLEAEQDER